MEKRIAQLEKIIRRQQFIEDRYEELMLSARRCWRYYGADQELFAANMKTMDFLIRRHATEIDEMNEEDNDDRPDNLPSNALAQGPGGSSPGPAGATGSTAGCSEGIMEKTCSEERPCINCFAGHGDPCLGAYKKPSWDECTHKWQARIDSQFSNENNEDVFCAVCGCPGDRDTRTGETFWAAT